MAKTDFQKQQEKGFTLDYYDPSKLPVLAVVGRPNVGKSTLINRLLGGRKTIVDDQPGVTRDRSYHPVEWCGTPFLLMDTGGVHIDPNDPFHAYINSQVKVAIEEADVIVFLVDGQTGVTDDDTRLAKWIRQSGKKCLLTVNKIDNIEQKALSYEFFKLGMGEPLSISALQGSTSVGDLLDDCVKAFPLHKGQYLMESQDQPLRLALIGRPNVGKSSLLNAIVGHTRTIVSDISGTTRDAIDIPFSFHGSPFILVDTAGIRRKTKVDYGIELFSVDRSVETIRNADVGVLLLDAEEGITEQDKRIMQKVLEAGKAFVIAINKWDLVPDKNPSSTQKYRKALLADVPSMAFAPMLFISATEQQRVHKVLEEAQKVFVNAQRRISTGTLNQVLQDAMRQNLPPTVKNKKLRVLYATQVSTCPPTFVLFCNDPSLMKETYKRYIERKLREAIELTGTPIRIFLRERSEKQNRRP
jgi:GTP-binding protein